MGVNDIVSTTLQRRSIDTRTNTGEVTNLLGGLNELIEEHGIGWEMVDGELVTRGGGRGFEMQGQIIPRGKGACWPAST